MKSFKDKELHNQQVAHLQKKLLEGKGRVSLKKGASNTLRNGDYKEKQLDFSSLNQVLEIHPEEKWILVEPRITFGTLCKITLKQGLIPPVVPEFSSITVGGAIMGAALESSSHRWGQVNDNCLEYELLLGNGEVCIASPEKNRDLFFAVSGSYGTLALLTSVKMKLIPAKKWVKLTFQPLNAMQKAVQMLTAPQETEFSEGIIFSPQHAIVITGEMTDQKSEKIFRQNRPWSAWYVQHLLKMKKPEVESMPLYEYLFRLDRGAFWMGTYVNSFQTLLQLVFRIGIPAVKPNAWTPSFLFRFLFGWALSSKRLYKSWHRVPNKIAENLFFIHDFYTPFPQAEKALEHFVQKTGIFPIWLCPTKGGKNEQFLSPHFGNQPFLNIGLYGMPKQKQSSIPELTSELEKDILNFGGRKMLYSFTYYDPAIFAKAYEESRFEMLRKKFFADQTFPSLYKKVTNNQHI